MRVNEKTQFLGHHSNDSDSSSYTPSAILSTPKCVYDPQYDKSTSGRFIPLMVSILVSSLSLFNVNQFIPLMVFVLLLSLSLFNGLDILVSTLVSLPVSVFAQSAQNVFSKGEDSEANNSESTDIDDRRKAKTVYRALEDVGRNNARPRLQRQCFIRRKDIQRKEYWKDAKEIDSHTQTFIAGCYWFKARISRLTMLHGESPWRVIGTSSVIVLVFGILYSLVGGIAVTNEGVTYAFDMPQLVSIPVPNWAAKILMNLYFSVVTFTTLGYGDIQPSNAATRALAGVESLLGAALIALLVFVLGRRATR